MKIKTILACSVALTALSTVAAVAQSDVETVVVTGSRVISDIQASPTPITAVSVEQLQETTPTDIPDGLNKLPVFGGSNVPRLAGNGGGGTSSSGGVPENVLNLRNFGDQRTLVLVDGHRAPPSNSDGSVDIDTLPQMLVSRVDVVTGGASAVYGSDAVTGVVNFILDKNFEGLKFDVNGGISTYRDGASFKVGAAYGTDLFDGRAHFEGSLRHYQGDMVPASARPFGALQITQGGGGTVANPDINVLNTRRLDSPFGGKIAACVPTCALVTGMQFVTNGVLGPFTAGAPVGTPASTTVASGGDGGYNEFGTAQSGIRQDEAFGRFSYDIDSDAVFYVQGTAAGSYSNGVWFPVKLSPSITAGSGGNGVGIYYKNNAFLTPAVQTALGSNGTNPVQVGTTQPNNTFGLGEYIAATGPGGFVGTRNFNRNLSVTTGLDGTVFGHFSWDVYYTHGETRQSVDNLNNTNSQNLFAASDAVLNAAGMPVCYASTQAATAAQYANCVPINPFGPTAVTQAAENYFTQTTFYHETNILDDTGGSISGAVFDGWAGPITAALSAEYRFNQLSVVSNASPTATVNCTGLRICTSTSLLWIQNAVAPISASDNVWEVAGETNVPVLKDLPLGQNVSIDLAGRYTDYSISGSAET
jgi:iron complex outermembrane recepter protein